MKKVNNAGRIQWVLDRLPSSIHQVVLHVPVEIMEADGLTSGTCNFGGITVRLGTDDNLEFVLAHEYLHAFILRYGKHPRLRAFGRVTKDLYRYVLSSDYYREAIEEQAKIFAVRHLTPHNFANPTSDLVEEALADSLADLVTQRGNKNPDIRSYGLPILENFLYYALDVSNLSTYAHNYLPEIHH